MTAPDSRRFGGIERLYGPGAVSRAARAHVCVIGIGGVGSWAVEALARSAIGRLTLIDLDHVAESNLNRQVQALETTLGAAKVTAMQARIAAINPACRVTGIEEFISADNVTTLLPDCDAVIDAIDNVRAKAALIAHCWKTGVRIVTTGGAGGRTDPTRIEIADLAHTTQDALAAKLRARLRQDYGFPRGPKSKFGVDCVFSDEPMRRPAVACESVEFDAGTGLTCTGHGSVITVTASFGLIAAAKIISSLLSDDERNHGYR